MRERKESKVNPGMTGNMMPLHLKVNPLWDELGLRYLWDKPEDKLENICIGHHQELGDKA